MRNKRSGVTTIMAACVLQVSTAAVAAENVGLASVGLKSGDVVNKGNLEQHRALLTPGLQAGVQLGWRLNVIEPTPIEMPRRYREATEKFAGQAKLSEDGLTVENYTAGRPFPSVDPADPKAPFKIMWNFYYNFAGTDDIVEKGIDTFVGNVKANAAMQIERHLLTDAYRKLNYNGRLYVDPAPEMQNPEGVRYKESVHPILEPFDVKGVGATFYRYLDPNKQDDSWLYLPQLRRVRRLSTAQRSDSLFGQDVDADGFWGYNGHIAWMDYKLVGEQTILATMHAKNVPPRWQEPEDWLYDDVWEPRRVFVVEAISKMPQYGYGKRILFVDKESYMIPMSDSYDRAGQLWKFWVNMWSMRKEAVPGGGPGGPYEDSMPFLNAAVVADVQLSHATSTAIPRTMVKADGGMYLNVGQKMGVTEDFFTVAHLVSSGK